MPSVWSRAFGRAVLRVRDGLGLIAPRKRWLPTHTRWSWGNDGATGRNEMSRCGGLGNALMERFVVRVTSARLIRGGSLNPKVEGSNPSRPIEDAWLRSDLYLSAGRSEPDPSFFAARFSLRRSLSDFCGFCFCCFFGLSELLLMSAI